MTALSLQAQIISYNSVDYVTSNQNLTRSYNLSGNTATVSFSGINALSPSSGYTGPEFFGGASINLTGSGTAAIAGISTNVQNNAAGYDRVNMVANVGNTDSSSKTLTQAALIYFEASPFNVTAANAFSASVLNNTTSGIGRWLVVDSLGDLYVSNETFGLGVAVATSTGLTTTSWALLDTSGSNYYQTYGSFGSISLAGLTGAGIYAEGSRTGITGTTTNVGSGFRLNEFTANGVPVPEASAFPLMAAGLGALPGLASPHRVTDCAPLTEA